MLLAWREYIRLADPDIITGYNICNFDFNYLILRAEYLGIKDYPKFTRINGMLCRIKDAVSQSSALGNREYKDMNTEGRIFFDMHTYAVRELKLVQYSLNSLSHELLGEQKEDIYPAQITQLFNGSDETRRRLATYGLKNARLPLLVMQKLDCLMQIS